MSDEAEHRILTVRQPWAWCIFHGKGVENRTHKHGYLGPLWIHASASWSRRGADDPRARRVWTQANTDMRPRGPEFHRSAILGRVDLVDCHLDVGCCRPWGESRYIEASGRLRNDIWHWVLDNPAELAVPVPAKGRLGIWRADPDLAAELDLIAA